MKRILLIFSLLFFAAMPSSLAQSLRVVEGRVVTDDGAPLEGAVLTVKNYDKTFNSDALGNFSIQVPYGYNYVSATYPDYFPATAEIDGSYIILKLKYDAKGVKAREEARMKAQQDSVKAATAAAAVAAAAVAKAEKERLAAEEQARKEAEAKAQAEAAAAAKAEKERIAAEEKARKEAEKAKAAAAVTATTAAAKVEKNRIATKELTGRKAEIKAKNDAYNEKFKNNGLSHSIDLCYIMGWSKYGEPSVDFNSIQLSYTLSYKFNRVVSLGIGTGVLYNTKLALMDRYHYFGDDVYVSSVNENFKEIRLDAPLFLNMKINMCRTKVRPYISLSGGYYLLSQVVMAELGLGCEVRFLHHCAARVQVSLSASPKPYPYVTVGKFYRSDVFPNIKVGFDF